MQIAADLVKIAEGEKCHIGQDSWEAQSPHRFEGGQEGSGAEHDQANSQNAEKPGSYQEYGNKPFLPQIERANARNNGLSRQKGQEDNHRKEEE